MEYGEKKPCFVAIASRWPIKDNKAMKTRYMVPTAEHKFLSVVVQINGMDVEIHIAHVPSGSDRGREWRKVRTLQGIYEALKGSTPRYRILCGDFNCPKSEGPDGEIVTWGRKTIDQNGKEISKDDWIKAEMGVLRDLEKCDLYDVFRKPAGNQGSVYCGEGYSWQGRGKPRRYDHVDNSVYFL